MEHNTKKYNVIIIGGGASGTALLYTLARYTNIESIALVEKYDKIGQGNSNVKNNSQTLHVGDIETHYTIDKVRQVKPASMMVAHYAKQLHPDTKKSILFPTQKMVLAVGKTEVPILEKRYTDLLPLFPELKLFHGKEIAEVEPAVMDGRDPDEPICALFNPDGYAVNFEALAISLADDAKKEPDKTVDVFLSRKVTGIKKDSDGYTVETTQGTLRADVVVFDTDAYSLLFAKKMGYGHEFSLIPIAGTFYFTKQLLRGKVYTMQDGRLPFASVHGDPDINKPDKTRWGPTARFFPVLESRNLKSMGAYFRSSGLGKPRTWKSFFIILSEPIRFIYLLKNLMYDLPFIGKYFFVKYIQKVVPTVRANDLRIARGFGGMRLQRAHIEKNELQLGEGKIIGDNIIFNMTPSPGASVCIYNGMRDAEQIMKFFNGKFSFDKEKMTQELTEEKQPLEGKDVSAKGSYSS